MLGNVGKCPGLVALNTSIAKLPRQCKNHRQFHKPFLLRIASLTRSRFQEARLPPPTPIFVPLSRTQTAVVDELALCMITVNELVEGIQAQTSEPAKIKPIELSFTGLGLHSTTQLQISFSSDLVFILHVSLVLLR
jgi:hypothetical protein